jgi:hypothetical protein
LRRLSAQDLGGKGRKLAAADTLNVMPPGSEKQRSGRRAQPILAPDSGNGGTACWTIQLELNSGIQRRLRLFGETIVG